GAADGVAVHGTRLGRGPAAGPGPRLPAGDRLAQAPPATEIGREGERGAMAQGERPAGVLLSGGLDSATALAGARRAGFRCHCLSLAYGQRHAVETAAAARVAAALGAAEHRVLSLDLRAFGGSALTADLPVPRDRSPEHMAEGIPITYVPARN